MEKVRITSTCWIWKGSKGGNGYGQFWNGTKNMQAHWFLLKTHPTGNQEACHHCDNKLCVRPSHIFIGTRSDNMRDCVEKGRLRPENGHRAMLKVRNQKGIKNPQHKLTEDQVKEARQCPRKYGAAIQMAKRFGVSSTIICDLRNGKRWIHVA